MRHRASVTRMPRIHDACIIRRMASHELTERHAATHMGNHELIVCAAITNGRPQSPPSWDSCIMDRLTRRHIGTHIAHRELTERHIRANATHHELTQRGNLRYPCLVTPMPSARMTTPHPDTRTPRPRTMNERGTGGAGRPETGHGYRRGRYLLSSYGVTCRRYSCHSWRLLRRK